MSSLAPHERLPEVLVVPREKTPMGAAVQAWAQSTCPELSAQGLVPLRWGCALLLPAFVPAPSPCTYTCTRALHTLSHPLLLPALAGIGDRRRRG